MHGFIMPYFGITASYKFLVVNYARHMAPVSLVDDYMRSIMIEKQNSFAKVAITVTTEGAP